MSALPEALLEVVAEVVTTAPLRVVQAIAEGFESCSAWSDVRTVGLLSAGPSVHGLPRLLATAATVDGMTPKRLADLLLGAGASAARTAAAQSVGVVWTGPTAAHTKLRRTEQALLEVLRHAQRRIWFVSYAVYSIETVHRALLDAVQRGVRVRLLLESQKESGGSLKSGGMERLPPELKQACECYVWPVDQRPVVDGVRVGSMHAKTAVADGKHLFVSSANLTEYAFEHNVELGLLLHSERVASVVEQQFDWLLHQKVLRRVGS